MESTSRKVFADKGYAELIEGFFTSIRKGTPQPVSLEDGVRATMVCLKLLEASKSEGFVAVDWQSVFSA
jgi:predicted dehydrogenase